MFRTSTPIHFHQNENNAVQCDDVCSDHELSLSSWSFSSGTGSTYDINVPPAWEESPNVHDDKKTQLKQIISEYRKNCWKHFNNIDSLIGDASLQYHNKKYFMLQNQMIIRNKISETKDDIQKLKTSIYNETVEQVKVLDNLQIAYGVIVWSLFLFVLILFCGENSNICHDWLYSFTGMRLNAFYESL